ncbi:hypothetical protein ZIOFF_041698 [Zingiber officinale]|uniref:Lethal giant larvae (Lgl)-like C-terminal domain-containing protein n=1 Tax=Zingiber officinale TaxID=94328 RepID=A0A8J5GE87_ZINOF|nr:hypothetical protein ZIOFF_041698 [Zingiber officinale]
MFVRKLVEKATRKNNVGDGINGLKAEDVKPRTNFHYGIPPDSTTLAYDPIQRILAVSTRNGVIKLFGKDNTQALLQSEAAVPSKFLQFMENQGLLFNVTFQNHIEVWSIDKKQVCHIHKFNEEITSFVVVKQSSFIYIGDCLGSITILMLDHASQSLVQMPYKIPLSESHGMCASTNSDTAVVLASPQPMAENRRILIIFRDGLITLWGFQESKVIYVVGGSSQYSSHEPKIAISASWASDIGSKVVVGYSSGDIFLWGVPVISDCNSESSNNQNDLHASQNVPLLKLNLGYKMDKVPIVSLRWCAHDEMSGRLYINGFNAVGSSHSFQVMILNSNFQSRTIKLMLPLSEPCLAMETISCFSNHRKSNQTTLVLLLRSGSLCLYDDSEIEHYLSQCQSKSTPSLPKQLTVKLPYGDSGISAAKLYKGASNLIYEDQVFLANKHYSLFSTNMKEKDGSFQSSAYLSGFEKAKNLLITGHVDGTVNFWDASCPLLLPIFSIKQQPSENYATTAPLTSLHFDASSRVLVSGDQSGLIRIFFFKKEHPTSENIFSFLQAKPGDSYTVQCVKLKGAITSISTDLEFKHLAVGTDKGYVSVIQLEETTVLYQKQVSSQLNSGIASLHFGSSAQNGIVKKILLVGTEDSSILPLEKDSGNLLIAKPLQPKKPSKALLLHVLDGAQTTDYQDASNESYSKVSMQRQPLILLCSRDAIRLYDLNHTVEGIKDLCVKKRLDGICSYASIIHGPSMGVGLVLIFACGKMEIRSLPDLAILNEINLKGLIYVAPNSPPNAYTLFSISSEGEALLIDRDQAMLFLSVLSQKEVYRHLECITKVYSDDPALREEFSSSKNPQKEKRKGILNMIIKDMKGNKTKHSHESDPADGFTATEELSAIFSTANFPESDGTRNASAVTKEDVELDIDDIDLEETEEKQKGPNIAVLSKQKLSKKFFSLKGKLKSSIEEKLNSPKDKSEEEKDISAVDRVKQKYRYTTNDEASTAKEAEGKLKENVAKLKDIGLRTSMMQNGAENFSSMAKELLQLSQGRKST